MASVLGFFVPGYSSKNISFHQSRTNAANLNVFKPFWMPHQMKKPDFLAIAKLTGFIREFGINYSTTLPSADGSSDFRQSF